MGRTEPPTAEGGNLRVPFDSFTLTRRAALARFALVAGGVASSRLVAAASAVAAPAQGFTAARAATFKSLVGAYDRQAGSIVDSRGRDLVAQLKARYDAADVGYRRWVDALLDGLEAAPDGAEFSALSVADRRTALRAWWSASESADSLMFTPRPGDSPSNGDVRVQLSRLVIEFKAAAAAMPTDAKELAPEDWLPRYRPASGPPVPITDGEPLGTTVRVRRQLRVDAYRLVGGLFLDDSRLLSDEAFQ